MAALLLVSNNSTFTVHAQGNEVYVVPSQVSFDLTNGTVGTKFNVTVWVDGPTMDMKAWQIKMYFNDTIINATAWYEPTWRTDYVFYGRATYAAPVPPNIGSTYQHVGPGNATVGCGSVLATAPTAGNGFSGTGIVAILTFKILATPPPGETYASPINFVQRVTYTYFIKAGATAKTAFDTYTNSSVIIVPELQLIISLLILMTATISVALAKKVIRKPSLCMTQ
jgi:hypothetical protein